MVAQIADLPTQLLIDIDKNGEINSLKYSQSISEPHQKVIGAIKSLESLGDVISVVASSGKCWSCTEEGEQISEEGSHEARLLAWLPAAGATVESIKKNFASANVALGAALKNKWVRKDGPLVLAAASDIRDQVQLDLMAVAAGHSDTLNDKQLADYRKRKLIKDSCVTVFTATKGPEFTTSITKQATGLTSEMMNKGEWRKATFKPFNFKAKGKLDHRSGHLHPLMQLRLEFCEIFKEMGFSEMPTNSFVESAFWNFDALFQPQQHPARDAHDTFYVGTPAKALSVPSQYMEKVADVHSNGGYGSSGYRYPWSEEEGHKNLLRTHTTAVTARMLQKLAQDGFRPSKCFSIDRVFRNETLDATHLAEFHQIEGLVADYNLGIKHLVGIITAFFEKIGIKNLRFKVAYNPYTEPSMEVFSYHEGLGKWVEIGNSGVFRPEMLRPMGLPENVSVLGFGLSLERPAMIMFGSNNIRELVGPRVKMELVYSNSICTVDKFQGTSLPPPGQSPTPGGDPPSTRLQQLAAKQEQAFLRLSDLQHRIHRVAEDMALQLHATTSAVASAAAIAAGVVGVPTVSSSSGGGSAAAKTAAAAAVGVPSVGSSSSGGGGSAAAKTAAAKTAAAAAVGVPSVGSSSSGGGGSAKTSSAAAATTAAAAPSTATEAVGAATASGLALLTGAPSLSSVTEVVVTADPRRPPHCLPPLLTLLCRTVDTDIRVHCHSTVQDVPASVKNFLNDVSCKSGSPVMRIRLIWSTAPAQSSVTSSSGCSNSSSSCISAAAPNRKGVFAPPLRVLSVKGKTVGPPIQVPRLVVAPVTATEIAGENNISRYMARLVELLQRQHKEGADPPQQRSTRGGAGPSVPLPLYEGLQSYLVSECDAWLDDCQAWLITGSSRGRANFLNKLSNKLGETEEGHGNLLALHPTLADVFVSSSLGVLGRGRVALNVAAWRDRCNSYWGSPS